MSPIQTRTMFEALSAELATMGEDIEGLAGLVADHVRLVAPEVRQRTLIQAQAVDELTQRLDALRSLATLLARGEPVEAALDAIHLADLADRLRSVVLPSAREVRSPPAAGDLMLFG